MKKIFVLMSTYNGEKYIKKQIDSILAQRGVKVNLIVRDDGSQDKTLYILEKYAQEKKLVYYSGENLGPAHSFMALLNSKIVKNTIDPDDFIAFSDQDDIWKIDKLKRATDILEKPKYKTTPSIYACNFQLIDQNDNLIENINHIVTTTFVDSIVFSSCTGCTMVLNYCLYKNLINIIPQNLYMHDDWIHKVCLALDGNVFFDKNYRNVFYRQHQNNVIGLNANLYSKVKGYIDYLSKSKYKDRMLEEYKNIEYYYKSKIPTDKYELINEIVNYKKMSIISRIHFINTICKKTNVSGFTKDFRLAMFFKRY